MPSKPPKSPPLEPGAPDESPEALGRLQRSFAAIAEVLKKNPPPESAFEEVLADYRKRRTEKAKKRKKDAPP